MRDLFIREIKIHREYIGQDSYIAGIPALINLERLEFTAPVTFLAGENGTGKSTLLEAVAVAYGFNPEGGTKNYSFSTYDSHSDLHRALTVVKGAERPRGNYFLRA